MYSYWQLGVQGTSSLVVLRHWCLSVGFRYGQAVFILIMSSWAQTLSVVTTFACWGWPTSLVACWRRPIPPGVSPYQRCRFHNESIRKLDLKFEGRLCTIVLKGEIVVNFLWWFGSQFRCCFCPLCLCFGRTGNNSHVWFVGN